MPITIYWSRPITWYPQNTRGHVSRVSKRVRKLVTFTLQYLKKQDLFDLTDNFPSSPDVLLCSDHSQTPSINYFALAPCAYPGLPALVHRACRFLGAYFMPKISAFMLISVNWASVHHILSCIVVLHTVFP